ncbi:hypothetical protein [Flavobacterium aquatile]|nr:hypothetical protein [Flavobacterium aquatile]
MKEDKYLIAVENLFKAIDIAVNSLHKYPQERLGDDFIDFYKGLKNKILNHEIKFKNLKSHKYNIEAVFTYFQECSGPDVEYFWKQIKDANLPFTRKNRLQKILKRKRIINAIEYDFVTDIIVPYHQEGMITEEEVILLNTYLGNFENRKKNKV